MKILNEVFENIFVITIPSFEDRIENMKQRLEGCEYEFFYGTYGKDIDIEKYRSFGSRLTRGQLACAASHIKVYEKIVNENLNNVLILEDDCVFHNNIVELKDYYSQLPKDYSVFYLGHGECSSHDSYSKNLLEVSRGNVSYTHCMNVSLECASKVLDINKNLLWTADGVFCELLNRYDTKLYLANPLLSSQDNNGSTSTLVKIDKEFGMGFK